MTIKGVFSVAIYSCKIHIIVTDQMLRTINIYNTKFNYLPVKDAVDGYILSPEDRVSDYYLFFDSDSLTVNAVNHEKSHLVEHILQDRGIKPNSEARSYLDGYVSNKMDLFFKKKKT